jgi:hypothetical protein
MSSNDPIFLLDDFPNFLNISNYTEDNLSLDSYSEIINPKPDLSEINHFDNNAFIANVKTNETNRKETKKNPTFKTESLNNKKGRGRKPTKAIKIKVHTSFAFDNILSKVQTDFLNFTVSLTNDAAINILHIKKKNLFKKFARDKKLKISSKYFNKLKNYSIKDLLMNMGISKKYKKFDRNINQRNLEKLTEDDWFDNFFEIKFLDLFTLYYNEEQPLKEIFIDGKTIILSEKTKSFYYLLEKYEKSREDIIRVTKMFYFGEKISVASN